MLSSSLLVSTVTSGCDAVSGVAVVFGVCASSPVVLLSATSRKFATTTASFDAGGSGSTSAAGEAGSAGRSESVLSDRCILGSGGAAYLVLRLHLRLLHVF